MRQRNDFRSGLASNAPSDSGRYMLYTHDDYTVQALHTRRIEKILASFLTFPSVFLELILIKS